VPVAGPEQVDAGVATELETGSFPAVNPETGEFEAIQPEAAEYEPVPGEE
jgi:hypothetical protein